MLILVRHGRTDANARKLLLGRLDPSLDDEGRRQARTLAPTVGAAADVITSPLRRARETAAELAGDAPVKVDERWIEIDYGVLDGTPLGEVPIDLWANWRADSSFTPPGGESLASLQERVADACDELAPRIGDEDIVVVSHVSPIKAAVAWALGSGPELAWRLYLAPASVTRIAIGPAGPVLHSFDETFHLRGPR